MIKKSEKFIILHFIIFSTFKMFIILHFIIFLTNPEIFIIFILSYFKYDNIKFALDFGKKKIPDFWQAQFTIKYTDLVSHREQCFGCSVRVGCIPFCKLLRALKFLTKDCYFKPYEKKLETSTQSALISTVARRS